VYLRDYTLEKILGIYEKAEGSPAEARRLLAREEIDVSSVTITNYWKKQGYEVVKRVPDRRGKKCPNGKGKDFDEQTLRRAYRMYDGSYTKAGKAIGCDYERLLRLWKALGLKATNEKDNLERSLTP